MKIKILLILGILALVLQYSFCTKPAANSKLPEVELKDLNGSTVNLAEFEGKPVLINFWATWCGPCREEIPMLNQLHKKYKDDINIIGISTDDAGAEVVKPFLQEIPIHYHSFLKGDDVEQKFGGIWALPTSFVYDRNGKQVQKIIGLQTRDFFEQTIQEVIK